MRTEADWANEAKGILKGELKRRNLTYDQLAERLGVLGVEETAANLANKVSRGKFTAVFFLQCLAVIGAQSISIPLPDGK